MIRLPIPEYVQAAIALLEQKGFCCYIVGGCVRDSLLGKTPYDYDLTTSATPDEMLSVFEGLHTIKTGLKHGTLTVVSQGHNLEITTFRTDGEYLDNRHPKEVSFSRNIADDLSRRDFTVNAMAYSEKDGLIDLFGGRADLEDKIIRCVGDPDRRFNEDGLRIMRGLRFAATLGFSIEPSTAKAIHENRELLKNIAVERIWSEFSKLICGRGATDILDGFYDVVGVIIPEMLPCVGFDQQSKYHCCDVYTHTLKAVDNCRQDDMCLRLAAFFHDIAKPSTFVKDESGGHFPEHAERGAEITNEIMLRFRTDNDTRKRVTRLVAEHCRQIEPTERAVRRFMSTHSEDDTRRTLELGKADRLACAESYRDTANYDEIQQLVDKIKADDACLSLKSLKIHGDDLIELGFVGKEIGKALDFLLNEVLDGKLENEKAALISAAEKLK